MTPFKPAWWLPNPHLQTIWPYLARPRQTLNLLPERLELADGDFIDLLWTKNESRHIIIVIHGLEGSINSHYARRIMYAIENHGWRGVFMHFRGCSGEHNRLPRSYHSGDTGDMKFLIETLRQRHPKSSLSAIGYSLGGNALLKYLGEENEVTLLDCAVTISVPFELDNSARKLEQGISRIYQRYLLNKLMRKMQDKFSDMATPLAITDISKLKTFRLFDNQVTAPLHGFKDVDDYYHRSSSRQYLTSIKLPTLILHAEDDPFMTGDAIPTQSELSEHVTLELHEHGGHVGFVSGQNPWNTEYWLEKRIPEFLHGHIK